MTGVIGLASPRLALVDLVEEVGLRRAQVRDVTEIGVKLPGGLPLRQIHAIQSKDRRRFTCPVRARLAVDEHGSGQVPERIKEAHQIGLVRQASRRHGYVYSFEPILF